MSETLREYAISNKCLFQVVNGDITEEYVDAIVNAANKELMHGGGVAGVIARKGGRQIQQQSTAWVQKFGIVEHGSPAYTDAGKLPCRFVIHAVGPIWGEGDEDAKLTAAIRGSLRVADQLGIKSIAFTAISTGIYGFPKARAARIFFQVIPEYIKENTTSQINLIRLVLYDRLTVKLFLDVWDDLFVEKVNE
ncbi:MAG TPA: macro domain-containing protein [Anaerolineae bacterium]|nr:macro domain-containing protein [Anaerolineae bacterium]